MQKIIKEEFKKHIETSHLTIDSLISVIEMAATSCIKSLKNDGKILLFGNGGSAADAQHIAAELIGRYKIERKGLPALALTTVFSRQVEAIANKNDVVIGISTSGNSTNVNKALLKARTIGCKVIGLSGGNGGEMNNLCDINLLVPVKDTPRIQEMHILIGHTICYLIDIEFNAS